MSGEHGAEATEHTKRFAELLSKFGWSARGRIDQNIDCQKCRKKANGNPAQHGVDGLFTFECPFSGKERGVVVDGKRHAMDSVGGPARLTKRRLQEPSAPQA